MSNGLFSGLSARLGIIRWRLACVAGCILLAHSLSAAPTITTPPAGAIICAGTNVVLNVAATGTGAVSYQWQLNRTNITGATSATLVRNNIQPIQQGHYRVIVTDTTGSATSDEALVVVLFPPTVIAQTGSQGTDSGKSVSFTVLATAKPPSTYQWRLNGVDITGATNNAYSIASVNAGHAGTYDCVLANSCGTATTTGSQLTVDAPPLIVSDPVDQNVDPGANVTFSVTATGSAPLSYQWCKDGVPIPNATSPSLLLSNVQFFDEAGYAAKVTNPFGSVTSRTATLTVSGRPIITLHPQDQAVLLGDSVTLHVAASGRAPISYQWMKGGVDIPGATSTNLALANITTSDLATYSARAFNAEGTAVSSNATLTISSRLVRVANVQTTNFNGGTRIAVPVSVVSEGGENRVQFSLAFDPATVSFATLSNRVSGATANGQLVNAAGVLTADWQLPSGQTLTAGTTTTIFDIVFTVNTVTNQSIVFLPVENTPLAQQMLGTSGQRLAARFINGTIVFKLTGQVALQRGLVAVNPLTGYTEETGTLIMPAAATISVSHPEFTLQELGNDSLGDPIILANATKTNNVNHPVIIHPGVVTPGLRTAITFEYDVSDRITAPSPLIVLSDSPGVLPADPVGGAEIGGVRKTFFVDRRGLANNVLDFPSTPGRLYYVQYRESGATSWNFTFPPFRATGETARWVDVGSPRTASEPTATRDYRVLGY